MISFGETSEILLNKSPATDADTILYKINALRTNGCTNMSAALMNVRDVLLPAEDPRKQGVLLLTDGHANRGVSTPEGLKQIIQSLLAEHPSLTLTSVGYGNDHNAELLRDMGTVGAGSYNVVHSLETVATVFGEVLGGLTTVVAQNVCVHLPPGSVAKTAYATAKDQDGTIQVRVGDIYAENEVVVLATLPAGADTVRVTAHNMLNFTAQEERLTAAPFVVGSPVPKHLEQAVFRYRVCEVLKHALDMSVDREKLKRDTEDLLKQLKDLPYSGEQLIQMMIDDLERMLETLSAPWSTPLAATTTHFAQHTAYLGLGRGLRSQIPDEEENEDPHHSFMQHSRHGVVTQDPAPLTATRSAVVDATFSPFSNRRQRNVTTTLRATSSQMQ